ncbi:MAG: ABC transporter ATP-binding protein, partial [Gammaproteobacteria bacterium]|nr:ABC transporter ATP-binding protein [Gammaproteobacteria bacterium]NIT64907.1 ABC transporter ATP-binding protein [Gammaproteobacteria bacterium]NIV21881.1 ABC transporter ATP-binding protein [Gammaproteobacteria bacterium]NIY33487.1 ABC transporter ATP-binding protein [Gammaproteobacteria bacterium]
MLTLTCPQESKLEMTRRITNASDEIADFEFVPPSLDDL